MELWNTNTEVEFFRKALQNFSTPEQLFYKLSSGYFAYIPTKLGSENQTLQSRNTLIGKFTEKWCHSLLQPIAEKMGLFAINGMVCDDLGLSKQTSADVAFCTTNAVIQKASNVKVLFEVKMSITNNYQFFPQTDEIKLIGDYKSHRGQPSIMRSDSMLKAVKKSVRVRVSGRESSKIPIFVLANIPIPDSYQSRVDFLKTAGVIQGFISLNPFPTQTSFVKQTSQKGFLTIDKTSDLENLITNASTDKLYFFADMKPKLHLGNIIQLAAQEPNDLLRAEKFLKLIYQ